MSHRTRCLRALVQAAVLLPMLLVGASQAADPVRVLIAYSSETGHTEKMARAAAEGVRAAEGEAVLRRVAEVSKQDLEQADAVMLGSPVHMGDVSVEMRRALVAWSRDYGFWESKGLENKVGAVFTTGGAPANGKEFTMLSMALGLLQFGMVLVSPYGGLGASATTAVPDADKGVDERELSEASELGKRVVSIAARMKSRPEPMAGRP